MTAVRGAVWRVSLVNYETGLGMISLYMGEVAAFTGARNTMNGLQNLVSDDKKRDDEDEL